MLPGCAGIAAKVTARFRGDDEPQLLFAVTEIVPLPPPAVAVIEMVEDVPVQPFGSVHVYEVAPATAVTE
jgi:hypothetical protein